jgi:hypothetical protein
MSIIAAAIVRVLIDVKPLCGFFFAKGFDEAPIVAVPFITTAPDTEVSEQTNKFLGLRRSQASCLYANGLHSEAVASGDFGGAFPNRLTRSLRAA